ncbi:MAG: TRAP transporter large permease subunit, partial [Spirochaetes bacterium]|nr:TRAP transporter large permease subunit [Spirochaetota bacterium]
MISGIGLVILALLGAPLFAIIAASAILGFSNSGIDLSAVILEINRISEMPVLISIPLFTFSGYILGETNTSKRLVALTKALLGWMPGGLAIVALTVCAAFTALTGASGVTIVALGALLLPALKQDGYRDRFSMGLITTSGSLGLLFPPSIPLILYAIIAGTSIDAIFLAGIFPGILMVVLLSAYSMRMGFVFKIERTGLNIRNIIQSVRDAIWEIPLPVIVLGGIYSGYFAISEAAAVTAFYVFIVEMFIYKEIPWKKLPEIMKNSMVLVGGVLVILGASLASTNYLIDAQVPMKLFAFIKAHVSSKFTFLLMLNVFLLILGCMLDIFSAIVLVVPLILPIATGYGVNPVHLGIIFLAVGESLGTARAYAAKYDYAIDANQELVALGAANVGAG